MKKLMLLCFIVLSIATLKAQRFEVESFYHDAADLSAHRFDQTDVNGYKCAIIKVRSNLEGLQFDSNLGITKMDFRTGEIWLYVSPGERGLKFMSPGYITMDYPIPERIESSQVYILELIATETQSQTLPVTLRYRPDDARLSIGNNVMEGSGTYSLTPGDHTVRIEKSGYVTLEKTINVHENQVFFEFELDRVRDAGLQIETTPPGAVVYVDEVRLGTTPLALFHKPGRFSIRIVREDYLSIENEMIDIRFPQTTKSYILEENVGYISVNTHSLAEVYFNDRKVEDPKHVKFSPQLVKVRVRMPKGESLEQQVLLKRNERIVLDLYPDIQSGTIQLAVTPFDAYVELTGDAGEKFSSIGMSVFEEVPIGTYAVKVSAAGYVTHEDVLMIKNNDLISRTINLSTIQASSGEAISAADLGIELLLVRGGTFVMGCSDEQGSNCLEREKPAHEVSLDSYYISKHEITQVQWNQVMGNNPSHFDNCQDCPVENVSYQEVLEFVNKLNKMSLKEHRLPTEAEWEYAARGGIYSTNTVYAGSNDIEEVAYYRDNSNSKTNTVGNKTANELGIFDMSGNVWEWCSDWFAPYSDSPKSNPQGPESGKMRVLRGGGWSDREVDSRVSSRNALAPANRNSGIGFRIALTP